MRGVFAYDIPDLAAMRKERRLDSHHEIHFEVQSSGRASLFCSSSVLVKVVRVAMVYLL